MDLNINTLIIKNLYISDEEQAEIQCWVKNIDNSWHHIVTHNPAIRIYIDTSLIV